VNLFDTLQFLRNGFMGKDIKFLWRGYGKPSSSE